MRVALVAAVFLSGQVLEGNFVTPKIVGDRVGLHPVWLLFAVTAGGALLGITGALLAVPTAAALGVLIRFAVQRYRESALYAERRRQGRSSADDRSTADDADTANCRCRWNTVRRWPARIFSSPPCNRDAVRWLERWPDWPTRALVAAWPVRLRQDASRACFPRPLPRACSSIIGALGLDQAIDVAARSAACIVDDADRAVAAGFEVPLLHLYNTLVERGGYLLLTAEAAARALADPARRSPLAAQRRHLGGYRAAR